MEWVAFILGVGVLVLVLASCPVPGLGRFIAPESTAVYVLVSIFSIRPLVTLLGSDPAAPQDGELHGVGLTADGWSTALWVGITSLTFFATGTLLHNLTRTRGVHGPLARSAAHGGEHAERNAGTLPRTETFGPRRCIMAALVGVAAYLAVLTALSGPAIVSALGQGRSGAVNLQNVPEIVLILPLAGSLAAALMFISLRGRPVLPAHLAAAALAISLTVVQVSALGNRRFLVPALLMPAIAWLISRPQRARLVYAAPALLILLFIATVPMVRSAGARQPGENIFTASWRYFKDEGLMGTISPIFTSYDTEMIDYIAVASERVGPVIPYGYGRGTFVEFFYRPWPERMLENVPLGSAYSDQVLTSIWGGGCAEALCPVASVAGVLYFDGGMVAVALGSFVFGALLRWLSVLWNRYAELGDFSTLVVAVLSSYAIVATRTNTVHAIWWALFTVIVGGLIYAMGRGFLPVRERPIPRAARAADEASMPVHAEREEQVRGGGSADAVTGW